MRTVIIKEKNYEVDDQNFLIDPEKWDRDFAAGMAGEIGMAGPLTEAHWKIIDFIRNRFKETYVCPVVHETTEALGLDLKSLKGLFPTGYLRGACLLAGISYYFGWVYYFEEPYRVECQKGAGGAKIIRPGQKTYRVDLFGSLVDPSEWDEDFARRKAYEMNMKGGLTEKHWQIIKYLRDRFQQDKAIPTIYDCCEANQVDIKDIARLFPTGYHRGAVKIAGLPAYGKGS